MAHIISAREKSAYRKKHNHLVARIADNLSINHCEKLCFFYSGEVIPRSFSDKHGDNPLKLLSRMQDAKAFSYDKPEKLLDVMEDINFEEMQSLVREFISMSYC